MGNKKNTKTTKEKSLNENKKEVKVVPKKNKKSQTDKKNIILFIILFIIILIIIILVSGVFSKKDDSSYTETNPISTIGPTQDDNPTPVPETNDTKPNIELKKHVLKNNKSVSVTLNDKKITIKNNDGKLYYNDQYIVDAGTCPIEFEFVEKCSTLYETDQYVLISTDRDSKEYSHIVNDKGKVIKIVKKTASDDVAGINDLVLVDGRLFATEYSSGNMKTVEFLYKNDEMTIVYTD